MLHCPRCVSALDVEVIDEHNYNHWWKCGICKGFFNMHQLKQALTAA